MELQENRVEWVVRKECKTPFRETGEFKVRAGEHVCISKEVAIHKATDIATKFSNEEIREDFDRMTDYKDEKVYVLRREISDTIVFELPE